MAHPAIDQAIRDLRRLARTLEQAAIVGADLPAALATTARECRVIADRCERDLPALTPGPALPDDWES